MHSLIVSNTWLIDGLFVCAALGTSSASMKMEMVWGGGYEIERSGIGHTGLDGTGVVNG